MTNASPFGLDPLSAYGTCLVDYEGEGVLRLEDGSRVECRFHAGQLTAGDVILLCHLSEQAFWAEISPSELVGTTADGWQVRTKGKLWPVNYLPPLPQPGPNGTWVAFRVDELWVDSQTAMAANRVHVGITNLEFTGLVPHREPDGSEILVLPLRLRGPDGVRHVIIKPIPDFRRVLLAVRTLKNIQVTAEIVGECRDLNSERLDELVDNLCYLLSLARGTKIQWVYQDRYDESGGLVSRRHLSRVTKPFLGMPVIDPRPEAADDTRIFLESVYPVYVVKRDLFRLNRGLIDAYLDARADQDYLETRGIKLAVVVEMIKESFVTLPESPVRDWILPNQRFKRLRRQLVDSFPGLLQEAEDPQDVTDEMFKKIPELNRRALHNILVDIGKRVGLEGVEEDVARIVPLRNRLVHSGRFSRHRDPNSSTLHDYLFLLNFLDRLMLRLLGYDGPYLDWRKPNHPERKARVQ